MVANDTIVALATAPGESAVAVTRLSGPDATRSVEEFRAGSAAGSASTGFFGFPPGDDVLRSIPPSVFRSPRPTPVKM
jgi:hypothetical protein